MLAVLPVLLGNCDQMIMQQKAALYSPDAQMVRPDPDAVSWQDAPAHAAAIVPGVAATRPAAAIGSTARRAIRNWATATA